MKKLVFNPGSTSIVYDQHGHMVDPLNWGYVEVLGTRVNRYLEDGRLIEVKVPDRLPEDVHPQVLPLLNEAINDRSAKSSKREQNSSDRDVRNTEGQPAQDTARKSNKEA